MMRLLIYPNAACTIWVGLCRSNGKDVQLFSSCSVQLGALHGQHLQSVFDTVPMRAYRVLGIAAENEPVSENLRLEDGLQLRAEILESCIFVMHD